MIFSVVYCFLIYLHSVLGKQSVEQLPIIETRNRKDAAERKLDN